MGTRHTRTCHSELQTQAKTVIITTPCTGGVTTETLNSKLEFDTDRQRTNESYQSTLP